MRQVNLTTIQGGLNRLRTKGAALNDSLFDLLNGYVTAEKTVRVRPGTVLTDTLPAGTVGLTAFNGKLQVFSAAAVVGIDTGVFNLNIVNHPTDSALTLSEIHFAEPFLGALYIAAEFSDGSIFHYWLQDSDVWEACVVYGTTSLVRPAVDNGFAYRATRNGPAFPAWTPGTPRALNDNIEPTVYSGFYFTAVEVFGVNPRSAQTEPDWPIVDGACIIEDSDIGGVTSTPNPNPAPPIVPPPDICTGSNFRYDRQGNPTQECP